MADTYTVTNQRQTSRVVGNTFQDVMEVTFQTTAGTVGSVTIPIAQYTADTVAAAINARVDQINAVHNL